VLTHGAWSCQRAVRWKDTICIRTYHDGYNGFPDVMLFDLFADPHEQHDLAADHPELVAEASSYLEDWTASMLRSSTHAVDPLWTIMREGGPFHTRGALAGYLKRLKETGRSEFAERVARNHPGEATELDA
jgi:choline-sulfatase